MLQGMERIVGNGCGLRMVIDADNAAVAERLVRLAGGSLIGCHTLTNLRPFRFPKRHEA